LSFFLIIEKDKMRQLRSQFPM